MLHPAAGRQSLHNERSQGLPVKSTELRSSSSFTAKDAPAQILYHLTSKNKTSIWVSVRGCLGRRALHGIAWLDHRTTYYCMTFGISHAASQSVRNGHPRVGTFSEKGLPDHLQPHRTLPWPGTALETQAFLNLASATISTATRRTTSLGSQLWPVVPPAKASVESPYSSPFECCYLVSGQAGHTRMDSNWQYMWYIYIYIYHTYIYIYMYTVYIYIWYVYIILLQMFAPDAEEECFDPFSTLNLRFKKAIAALKKRNDKCYDAWTMLCDGRVCFESVGRPAILMNPSTEFDLEVYRNQVMYQYQVLGFFLACHPDPGLNFLSTAGANHTQKCSHSKLTWSQLLFHSRNSFCHKKKQYT